MERATEPRVSGRHAMGRGGLAMALLLAAAGFATLAQARTFRAADNQVLDYPTVQALLYMDQIVRARTGGRHSIQVFHSRQLGEESDTIEQTRAGAIDINRVNVSPLGRLSPAAALLTQPFLFRSEEHLHRVLEGPIGDEILASFEPKGLIGLTFYDSGTRSIYNDVRPVRALADLAGLRIRVQNSELMVDLMKALGAQPVTLSYGQVLSALQTGLIDGAENNWPSYVTTGHFRRARFITETNHTMPPEILLISGKAWAELSDADRAIFREAARESSRFMRERWRRWVTESRDLALSSGVAPITDFDRTAFENAAAAIVERYLADPNVRSLRDRVQEVR